MLGEFGEEIQRFEYVYVFSKVLVIVGMEQYSPFEWLIVYFFQGNGMLGNILGKTFHRFFIQNTHRMIDAETRMLPGEHVPCELLVNELFLHKKPDNNPAKIFSRFSLPGKMYVIERTFIVKTAF